MASSGLRYLYVPATDLAAMREFYSGAVGLHEMYFSEGEGALAYNCAGFQFTVYFSADADPLPATGWAIQPGWPDGGNVAVISWSVELDRDDFAAAVRRVRELGGPVLHTKPIWIGYWSFPAKDPMGNHR